MKLPGKIIVTIVIIISSCYGEKTKEMFEVAMSHGEPNIKNHKLINLDNIKVKRINRTCHAITGSFVFQINVDETVSVQLLGYKKAGNDYKMMPYKYGPKSLCVLTEEEELFYPYLIKYTNFPPRPRCDFKSGSVYTIDNYIPDISNLPPIFESGDYALEVKIFQNEEYLNGYRVYGSVLNFLKPSNPVG